MVLGLAVSGFSGEAAHVSLEGTFIQRGEMAGGWFVCLKAVETTGWAIAFDCRVVLSRCALEGIFVAEMANFTANPTFLVCWGNTAFICRVVKCKASLTLFVRDRASSQLDAYSASKHEIASFCNLFSLLACFVNEYK
jgi:hypothetical protein